MLVTQTQKIRDFIDSCASSAECDTAYEALAELEAIAKWAANARCYLESMACRYHRDGDLYGECETASRLLLHPEIAKRCAYNIDDGSKCRFHKLAGGECKTDMPMSHVLSHHIGEVALTSAVVSASRPRIEIEPDALIDSPNEVIANLREMHEFLIRQLGAEPDEKGKEP